MLIYILDKNNLKIKDVIQVTNYSIEKNINYSGKGIIYIFRKPLCRRGDIITLKEYDNNIYLGICDNVENTDGKEEHIIRTIEIENLFNEKIIKTKEKVLHNIGIEDFIETCIQDNFIENDDPFSNLNYLVIHSKTHTPVFAEPDTENGIFNLKTYIGNALEHYGIFLNFSIGTEKLKIEIEKKQQEEINLDTTLSDIVNYEEIYKNEVLSKLVVLWKIPDKEENGIIQKGVLQKKSYFLRSDRTITEDKNNPERVLGKSDMIYIEKETAEEMYEDVVNQFRSNSYEHSIEADVYIYSKIYPINQMCVGHECMIKTKSGGIQKSLITCISYKSSSQFLHIKFGKMKVTLLEKLKGIVS